MKHYLLSTLLNHPLERLTAGLFEEGINSPKANRLGGSGLHHRIQRHFVHKPYRVLSQPS